MNLQKLSRLDLNLLVSLQALMEERSVTRAAERLYITQPAMSRVLQRLRDQLDDPLFTRSGNRLIPSPKAEKLAARLPSMLDGILEMVNDGEFSPASYEGEIAIVIPEFFAISVISELTSKLNEYAPGVTLSVTGVTDSIEGDLATGALDFAVDIAKSQSEDIKATDLAAGSPSIWMRNDHPLAGQETLSLDEILKYPFIQYYLFITKGVNARTDSRFDRELHRLGRKRKKALVTRQFFTAIETLVNSDCLMVAAAPYGEKRDHDVYPVVQKRFPADLPHAETISLVLLQHKRTIESPIHRWLADAIIYIVTKMHINWS